MEFVQKIFNDIFNKQGGFISIGSSFSEIVYDPDDSKPTYIGLHKTLNALDADTGWIIYKFTYSGANTTHIQRVIGAWKNRDTLF
jgi:hypothetical protein